jgi:endoglucanase
MKTKTPFPSVLTHVPRVLAWRACNINKRFTASAIASACLLMLPVAAFAQLPSPTYGWNLGNTMEPPSGVGSWDPAPTQTLINAVADAGFNTIRIPCAWDSHANASTHQIDSAYMAQVKQVVDWSYARGLHVIINDHWDNGWLQDHLTGTVDSTINAKMSSYWTQIANTFKSYDDDLLFAAANEPNADNAAKMAELMTYYQTFVNAVRSTGGYNSSRWLVVQGPKTDINTTDSLMNSLPNDSTSGRLMVEVHYYDPYQFTLMSSDQSWGKMFYFWGAPNHTTNPALTSRNPTWGEESDLDKQFAKMQNKFVNKGVPVLLGEFGCLRRTSYADITGADLDLHLASRVYYDKYVVDSAHGHGMYPIYWDDGGLNNNADGLFDRNTAALVDVDVSRAMTGPAITVSPIAQAVYDTGYTDTNNGQPTWTVTSNSPWTVDSASVRDWFTLSQTSGPAGRTTITMTVSPNSIMNERRAQWQICCDGSDVCAPAQIIQFYKDEGWVIEGSGGPLSKLIVRTGNWTATSSAPSWLSVTPNRGTNGTYSLYISAPANTTGSTRTATLTISGGGPSQKLQVVQPPVALVPSPTNISVAAGGAVESITITSNTNWWSAYTTDGGGWLSINSGSYSGSGDGTVFFTVSENTTGKARTATITLIGGNVPTQTVRIVQVAQ